MAVFDPYIGRVRRYLEGIGQEGTHSREFFAGGSPRSIVQGLPVRVGPSANPGVILRADTFVELGNPLAGSCSLVLWTDNPRLIRHGRILLLGPDIPESAGGSLPFGQILIVGGRELADRDHEALVSYQYVADRIEGYMIKSAPDRVWSRVSRKAAAKGFDFQCLGRALIYIFLGEDPRIESMEVTFITSGREAVEGLQDIAVQVRKISREIIRESWKVRGYDIECSSDCNACADRAVCDDIRAVLSIRKKKERGEG